jgi:prepilin-type N-terminal cleavage/methylation domain-containing protein
MIQDMKHKGFTVVELIIVIVVIGILAGITIIGYGAWRDRTAKTEVMSDLRNAAVAMNNYRNFNNVYPTSLSQAGADSSPGVTMIRSSDSTTLKYCIQATSNAKTSIVYYINSVSKDPIEGACPALQVDPPTTPIFVADKSYYSQYYDSTYINIRHPINQPSITSYNIYYRTSSSSSWIATTFNLIFGDPPGGGGLNVAFNNSNPVTTTYKSNPSGALRIVVGGAGGLAPPLDIPYSRVAYRTQ